jgi:hypothetical protein
MGGAILFQSTLDWLADVRSVLNCPASLLSGPMLQSEDWRSVAFHQGSPGYARKDGRDSGGRVFMRSCPSARDFEL